MSIQQSARDVALRFGTEVFEIQRQVNFLRAKAVLTEDEIDAHNEVLRRNGVAELPVREGLGLPPHHLDHYEIIELVPALDSATAAMDRLRSDLNRRIDAIDVLAHEDAVAEYPGLVAEWIEYLSEHMSLDATPEEVAKLRNWLQSNGSFEPLPDEELPLKDKVKVIDAALSRTAYAILRDRTYELYDVSERFDEIKIIAESGTPGASMGTYRLAFIAMMAAFEAAIFDLVAVAVLSRFDELSPGLGKWDRTKKELAEKGNTAAVRERIIEERLKFARASDLLTKLRSEWGVNSAGNGSADDIARLNEVVQRRNLLLHKRGIVDERYLELDSAGKPKYNVHNLRLESAAIIDETYWSSAKELCSHCIRQVAIWAKQGS